MHKSLLRSGSCIVLAAVVLIFGAVDQASAQLSFVGGWAEYTHDVDSPLLPPLGAIVVPAFGDLEGTSGSPNSNFVSITGVPALAHTTIEDPLGPPSSTATGGLYQQTFPTSLSLLLPAGVGIGQTDPGDDIGASALYTQFSATWEVIEVPVFVFPFMSFYVAGTVGDGGFVGFDAEWNFSSGFGSSDEVGATTIGLTDRGTLSVSYLKQTSGAFGAPLFTFGTPFIANPGEVVMIDGLMRSVAQNPTTPSNIGVQGGGGLNVVPLPAAVWTGLALLGGVGGVGALRRRRGTC